MGRSGTLKMKLKLCKKNIKTVITPRRRVLIHTVGGQSDKSNLQYALLIRKNTQTYLPFAAAAKVVTVSHSQRKDRTVQCTHSKKFFVLERNLKSNST